MTILYLHQYFTLPRFSGGTRSYDLAKRFQKSGHKVIVVTSSAFLAKLQDFSKGWTVLDYEGLELHVFHAEYSNKTNFFKRIVTFIKFVYFASFRVLEIPCDIVLATSTPITIGIPALLKKRFQKIPFIFEVRDVWPEVPIGMGIIKNKLLIKLLNSYEKGVYKNASHIVPLSSDMHASIVNRTKVDDKKLTVITNISEVQRFSSFDAQESIFHRLLGYKPTKTLIYAGTLGMANGLKYLVDLAATVQDMDSEIKILVFGDGMEKDDVEKYAREKKVLNENLFLFDPLPKSQLAQIYYECTAALSLFSSVVMWANSANKFFDCLASGRPIIINYGGWQADVINKEHIGLVLDWEKENLRQEARKLCQYVNDTSLLELHGKNARRLAEREYSLDIASGKYDQVIQSVFSNG